jgi:hypothetical protein
MVKNCNYYYLLLSSPLLGPGCNIEVRITFRGLPSGAVV